ncbi:hypothetical protein Q4I30_004692 [Leishmania utingensis]|uniref:Uncharacterized protein n=1 Tax=Leishmania utingensis TaxID=653362 RepID=A0AAW3AF70_9TRYP
MDVDQHTVATISEIDRTLRSLGIQDDYPSTLSQPSITYSPLVSVSTAVTRANGAAQTNRSTRVSTGVQKSPSLVQQGVQHSPQQRVTSSQTENEADTQECFEKVASSVVSVNAILEEKLQELECTSNKLDALFAKLTRLEGNANSATKCLHLLQHRWTIYILESEEVSTRSVLLNCESNTRIELISLLYGELVRLVAESKERVLSKPLNGLKRLLPNRVIANPSVVKDTPNSSLNDLTELLDECWQVLDE